MTARPSRVAAAALLAAASVALVAPRALADEAAAREHFRHGVALYDDKRFDEALVEFRAAYAEKASPGIQQNIGLTLEALGRPIEAAAAFDLALAGGDALRPGTREAIERELEDLSKRMATVRFSFVQASGEPVSGARLEVDGARLPEGAERRPVRLAPGIHTFRAHAPGLADPPEKKLALLRGAPVDATFVFGGAVGTLTVRPSVEGALVRVDGREVGHGAWTGELAAGAHHVEVSAPGFEAASSDVTVTPGATIDVPITMGHTGEPAPYVAPVREPPPKPKRGYVVAELALQGGSVRFSSALGEGADGARRSLAGAALGVRGGYSFLSVLAVELRASLGSMKTTYQRGPNDVLDSEAKLSFVELMPGIRFTTKGQVRFTSGTSFGLHNTTVEASIAEPGRTDDVKGSGLAFGWTIDAGAQFEAGPVFLEGLAFAEVWGVGPVRDGVSSERLLLSSPASRFGVRVGLGIPF